MAEQKIEKIAPTDDQALKDTPKSLKVRCIWADPPGRQIGSPAKVR